MLRRTSYIVCRARCKMKMWDPYANFKMGTAEHHTKYGALPSSEPCVLVQMMPTKPVLDVEAGPDAGLIFTYSLFLKYCLI